MTEYTIERLSGTTFVLRPDYDSTVAQLGGEPPLGVPEELTFEWAWAKAEDTVRRARRAAERRSQSAQRTAATPPAKATTRARKSPRKATPGK